MRDTRRVRRTFVCCNSASRSILRRYGKRYCPGSFVDSFTGFGTVKVNVSFGSVASGTERGPL